jgi:hypothetical protein
MSLWALDQRFQPLMKFTLIWTPIQRITSWMMNPKMILIPVMIFMVQMNHIDCYPTCRVKWCLFLGSRVFLSAIFILPGYYNVLFLCLTSPMDEAKGEECSDPH